MLDRANFSSPPLYRRGFELFTLIGRHKVHRKAQSKMSQQALTQTPRREERAATLYSPAPSRRAVGGRGNRTARLLHTPAMRRATPRVPAPPGMPLLRHMDDPASHLSLKAASAYSTDQAGYRYRIEGGKRASSLPTPHRKTWPSPRPSTALPVTAIAAGAFSDLVDLERVSLPDSLTSLGAEAFARCTSLRAAKLGCALESIGEGTFRGCSRLERLDLPKSLTNIGN